MAHTLTIQGWSQSGGYNLPKINGIEKTDSDSPITLKSGDIIEVPTDRASVTINGTSYVSQETTLNLVDQDITIAASGPERTLEVYNYVTINYSERKSVDLTTLSGWANLSAGNHTIKIKAKGTGYKDSELSTGVTVSKAASTVTLEAGTYKFNDTLTLTSVDYNIEFTSNSQSFTRILRQYDNRPTPNVNQMLYYKSDNTYKLTYGLVSDTVAAWTDKSYKTITLSTDQQVSQEFYTWFTANANKVYTLEAGTYKWINSPTLLSYPQTENYLNLNFTSNNVAYELLGYVGSSITYWPDKNDIDTSTTVYAASDSSWTDTAYKTITLSTSQTVSAEFYNWAITQGNLVKQTGYNLTINYSTVPMSTSAAYIKINSDTVSSTNYDYVVQPGTSSTNPTLKNSAGTTLTVPYVVPNVEKVAFMGGLAVYVGGSTNNTSPYTLTADTIISPGVYGPTADTPIDGPTI